MTELQGNQREIVERTALLIGGMALLSGLLAAALGVRLVGQPLRQLMEKTRLIAAGNLQGPVHLGTHDELAELGESLNLMCQQLAAVAREDSRGDRHPHRRHGTTPPCGPAEDGRPHGLGDRPRAGHSAERRRRPRRADRLGEAERGRGRRERRGHQDRVGQDDEDHPAASRFRPREHAP